MNNIPQAQEKSLGELFSELSRETSALIQQEMQLAKVELTDKATAFGKRAAMIVAGGVILYAGFLALIATLIIMLATVMDGWLAALLVTLAVLIGGGALVMKGINDLKNINPKPEKTIETLKEDKAWLQQQIK